MRRLHAVAAVGEFTRMHAHQEKQIVALAEELYQPFDPFDLGPERPAVERRDLTGHLTREKLVIAAHRRDYELLPGAHSKMVAQVRRGIRARQRVDERAPSLDQFEKMVCDVARRTRTA